MFVKVVPNHMRRKDTSLIYLTESDRENGKVKHHTIRNLGLLDNDRVSYIRAAFAKTKPRLVYDDNSDQQ